MERTLIEYLANSIWQVPLLAGSAWLAIRVGRPGPRAQHWAWLSVLALSVLLPLHGMTATENRDTSTTREVKLAGMGDRGSHADPKAEVLDESAGYVASTGALAEPDETSSSAGRVLRGANDRSDPQVTWVEGQGAAVGDETAAVAPTGGWAMLRPNLLPKARRASMLRACPKDGSYLSTSARDRLRCTSVPPMVRSSSS